MEAKVNEKQRVISFDVMRIIAVMMVVMVHVLSSLMNSPLNSKEFIVSNVISGVCRIGVPLFVMISGALMLDEKKEITIKEILFKYVKNIVILLVFWSVAYSVFTQASNVVLEKGGVDVKAFLKDCIYGYTHLWFLFMLIGLYLITPILKLFVNKQNEKFVAYFLILAIIFCLLPKTLDVPIAFLSGKDGIVGGYFQKFSMGFVLDCTIYYLLGWYVVNVGFKPITRKIIYILGILGLVYTVFASQFFSTETNRVSEIVFNNLSVNIFIYALAVFSFIYEVFKGKELKCEKAIIKLSGLTFGVYVVHVAIVIVLTHFLKGQGLFIRILVEWVIAIVVSFVATWIISKIPFVKKVVRG